MKKILSLAIACLFAVAGWAQDNLALIEGTVATASLFEGAYVPQNAIDGDKGTRWGGNAGTNEEKANTWFQVEWTEAQTFNTIKMLCEGAMASNFGTHSYVIQTSDNGTDWTDRASVVDGATNGGEYETVTFTSPVTAKFVRLQSSKAQTYGYSFFEFEVYKLDLSNVSLTTFSVAPSFLVAGVATPFTYVARDENNQPIDVTLSAENATIEGNIITATAPGNVVVKATAGKVTLPYNLLALGDANAPTTPDASKVVWPIFSNGNTVNNDKVEWVGQWNEKADISGAVFTIAEQEVKPVYAAGCVFVGNGNAPFHGWMTDFDAAANGAKTLFIDVFTANAGTGKVKFETAGLQDVTFSTTAGQWTTLEIDVTTATAPIHVVSICMDAVDGNFPDILLSNIYFSGEAKEVVDPVDPVDPVVYPAPNAPNAADVTWPLFSNGNTANNETVQWVGAWNEKADVSASVFTIEDMEVKPVKAAGCVFVGNDADPFHGWIIEFDAAGNGAKSLFIDIYTADAETGKLKFETAGLKDVTFTTTAGQWTTLEVDVTPAEKAIHVVSICLDAVDGVYPDCLLSNIYFSSKPTENPTGISSVAASAIDGTYYNLAGQRTRNAQGVVIMGGKKVVR